MNAWHHRKRERLDGLEILLKYAPGASVLDVGCYRGLVGYEFARHGAALVHGCDQNRQAIETARKLFEDVECESKFEVVNLVGGIWAGFLVRYDIVLLLGVLHKLRRVMSEDGLSSFLNDLGDRSGKFFAWNGFEEEWAMIDRQFTGLRTVHRSDIGGNHVAIWSRDA